MLEDVAEKNRVELFGAQVVPHVILLDVPDHDLFGPDLGCPGRLRVHLDPDHPATPVDQCLGHMAGGTSELEDGLVETDHTQREGMSVVIRLGVDHLLVDESQANPFLRSRILLPKYPGAGGGRPCGDRFDLE